MHLSYHQKRVDFSLQSLSYHTHYPLSKLISPPDEGIYRCRFLYDDQSYTIEYHPYIPRSIHQLKIVHSDLSYPLKYADRTKLNQLFAMKEECDDILIVQNGLLTDTSIANIALFIDNRWLTPSSPILKGTTRARLIDEKQIFPADLGVTDIPKASKIAIMNAMMGFVELDNGIIS